MNTEQIIQSTDPGLRLLRLHPSCYVFTVARSQNLIPSHHVQSCEPNQSDVLLKGTVGRCSVWEKQKRFLCGGKHAKICSFVDSTVIRVFNRPRSIFSVVRNRNFLSSSYRLVLCRFVAVRGTLCVASDAQYIIYTSKLAVRVKFEGIFIQKTCEVYRLISLIS